METSLALVLPDRSGALREVMRVFTDNHVSVLRVSYNRVIDVHALFVDVTGTQAALDAAQGELRRWHFLPGQRKVGKVYLFELTVGDDASIVEPVLTLIQQHELNITYVNVRTDGVGDGAAQIAVYMEDPTSLDELLSGIHSICPVRLVPRSDYPDMLDNNHFTLPFAHDLARKLDLNEEEELEILVNSNRIMQNLMGEGDDPFKPFGYIRKVAEAIAAFRGPAFKDACRITRLETAQGGRVVCIEPPIGSDVWIFECDECLLLIDAGYRCFANELEQILRDLYPDWDQRTRRLVLTHADIDHVGACHLFDEVYATAAVINNFQFESMGIAGWREQNPLSFPYARIGSVLSGYRIPDISRMRRLGEERPIGIQEELLRRVDTLEMAPYRFEVWEGKGGHVRGETVLIDRAHRVCVSGDIFVNVHAQTKPQARFNQLAPALMLSVDSVPDLARTERSALFDLLGAGQWLVMGGHGAAFRWERRDDR